MIFFFFFKKEPPLTILTWFLGLSKGDNQDTCLTLLRIILSVDNKKSCTLFVMNLENPSQKFFLPLLSYRKTRVQEHRPSTWDLLQNLDFRWGFCSELGLWEWNQRGCQMAGCGKSWLERDGQDKQATGGLKNEWINIQTKVNSAGESNPVSTAGEVLTHEFNLKSLKELLCIWFWSILALGHWVWGDHTVSGAKKGLFGFYQSDKICKIAA